MGSLKIRSLDSHEVSRARDIVNQNHDLHCRYVVKRLPDYFNIVRELYSDAQFGDRQRLLVGAFSGEKMIGTVAAERVSDLPLPKRTEDDDKRFRTRFTEHEMTVYQTLETDLAATYIGAPAGSLIIHSLGVSTSHRRGGVARSLVDHAIKSLDDNEQLSLHIEFARIKWLEQFGTSLGFSTIRKTFSFTERLQYGCWGSVLMRYQAHNREVGPLL